MAQRGQCLAHLVQTLEVYRTANHAGAFGQHVNDLAPGVDQHAVAPGTAAVGMLTALRRRQHVALVFDGAGAQQHSVWVVETDGTVHARPVTLGGYGTGSVPVLSGLSPEDWVVAAGGHLLHEGQPVHALDRSNRPVQGD